MPHVLRIEVSDRDIDELGHASNVSYVRWVLDAALSHSRAVGLGIESFRARGQSFVVHRHELDYLRPAFVGDVLEVETRVVSIRTASSVRETLIRRERGDVLLRARTSWAYIDLESGRATRIPAEVRERYPIDEPLGAVSP